MAINKSLVQKFEFLKSTITENLIDKTIKFLSTCRPEILKYPYQDENGLTILGLAFKKGDQNMIIALLETGLFKNFDSQSDIWDDIIRGNVQSKLVDLLITNKI